MTLKKIATTAIALLFLFGCATYKTKYQQEFDGESVMPKKEVAHTFYLIGDAGLSPMGGMNKALKSFKAKLDTASKKSTAIFLGDNIYPAGLPDPKDSTIAYLEAKNHLDAQIKTLENFKGKRVFIPGNHDWYTEGLIGLKREENYIEEQLGSKEVFFPENGCPIEAFDAGDDVRVITIDTEWYLTNWDNRPDINDKCEIKDRERFLLELEDEIKDNRQKTTIIALHHPMFTYGPHGGQYSFEKQFYPSSHVKVPLPILGTVINELRKTSGASIADQQSKIYNDLKNRIVTLAQFSEKVIFVSGHEHTLQYIVEENTPQIVSGSGAKKGATRLLNGSKFSTGMMGYAILKVFKDGSSAVDFYGVEENSEELIYSTAVLSPDKKFEKYENVEEFPPTVEASIYSDEETDKSGFYKAIWGDRYREYYSTKVEAPTVNLDTLYGGLKPVKKGGGHQSFSLRLEHKDGRQFVMRALRKSAEVYLQSLAFKDQYVIGEFEDTATEALLQDFYTGSHPYAPFAVAELSDAVGLYHTNPILFYVPKQEALGGYNVEFGNALYMIEEHTSEGHNIASFGYAKKIESTNDFIEKLREDEEYKLDKPMYVRARLFDMLLGDWDRHTDQWRWVEVEQENGDKIFRPIPRDRDQVFSIMGDGGLMAFASKTVPALRLFEGFNKEIKSVKGFNSSPMTFALDMALLSETTLDTWISEAEFIQNNISPETVDKSLSAFPPEVREATAPRIKEVLLARKTNLVETAKAYYKVLNKYTVITGTDKDDYFDIKGNTDGSVSVKVYRIKGGKKKDLFYNKTFDPNLTKEIWVYGLDDDDVFEIPSNEGKIKIRLVGGHNNDIYKIGKVAKNVKTYDFKEKPNTYDEAFGGVHRKINDYDTNTYQFLKIKASNNQFLPAVGFNPDDGVKLGFTNTYTYNGFRQNPFTSQHTLAGYFYFATSGLDFSHSSEFTNVIEGVNLELASRFTTPNFSRNFFGFGNETVNNDDDLDLDFNRVKIRTIVINPSLVWRGRMGSVAKLGASYENYDVEETEGRFIEDFYSGQGRDTQQDFFGVNASYAYRNSDNEAFPTLGMQIKLEGGFKTNVSESGRSYGYIIPSLGYDRQLIPNGRLVFATMAKAHFNIGNNFEFYQAANIGANNGLRGFRFQRFNGKKSFYQNTDIRYSFRRAKTSLLPITPGIYGGFDYGRVWLDNDTSNIWHTSYGGGFFINGSDLISANFGLFNSDDGLRFAFGVGFGF